MAAYPDAMNLEYEDCVIESVDDNKSVTTIHGWLVKQPGGGRQIATRSGRPTSKAPAASRASGAAAVANGGGGGSSEAAGGGGGGGGGDMCPTIIFFHGNAGNISHRLDNVAELMAATGCHVLMVEYRGFGLSSGTPSQVNRPRRAGSFVCCYGFCKLAYSSCFFLCECDVM